MVRSATAAECLEILRERPDEVSRLLPVEPVQLSYPLPGGRACIKVSVRPGERRLVPNHVRLRVGDEDVSVSLVVEEDYQDYRLH